METYHLASLFFLILFSFIFLYSDFKYQKIPNIVSLFGIIVFLILAYLSGFFAIYGIDFLVRTIILFFIFYFLYLQSRVAGGDFKLYFVLSGFLLLFLFTAGTIKINWLYFDMYIIFYSLFVGFFYLILRYLFLYIKKGFKFNIDEFIKAKFIADRKDAILHFTLFTRSVIYSFFYIFLENSSNNSLLIFLIVVLEFTFIGYFLSWLKDISFKYLDWFIRKKELKYFSVIFFLFTAGYLIYLHHYSLVVLLIIFTFLDYIIASLQLNFDTKIVKVEDLSGDEKLSIRNFPIQITKTLDLTNEIELDEEVVNYIQKNNIQNIEIITEVPYGIFLVIGIFVFLYQNVSLF